MTDELPPEKRLTPVSVAAFADSVNGQRGDLDAWLECNNEAEVRAHVHAYAAAAVAQERERCAKLCEALRPCQRGDCDDLAAAIRNQDKP